MHSDPDNLESLHNKREQASYRKASPEYIQLLLDTVDTQPQELGYEFGRWAGERLKELLQRLLNQGELVIKWQRKIKNKVNNYIAT